MQTLHHTMAHRGPGATRTNARWHPYTPPRPSGAFAAGAAAVACNYAPVPTQSIPQQNLGYLLTPASAVSQFTPASSTFSQSPLTVSTSQKYQNHIINPLPVAVKAHVARSSYDHSLVAVLLGESNSSGRLLDFSTQAFFSPQISICLFTLVFNPEQTVKSLSDIWRPEGIPAIFKKNHQLHQTQESISDSKQIAPTLQPNRNTVHLPSPCSPSSQSIPGPITDPSRIASFLNKHYSNVPFSERELLPLKHFVKEVLYRSRTTRPVLESALCYIEAVRKKIPDLVEKEKQGLGVWGEPELDNRVTKELGEASASSSLFDLTSDSSSDKTRTELMSTDSNAPTVLQEDTSLPCHDLQQVDHAPKRRKISNKPLPPLIPLPSPLLCPRRTFLAALILASKFLQDRCYSNRAWAKLSGLPPREVGRCERALGEALEWRLWVGKGANFNESANRTVSRTRSESALSFGSNPVTRCPSYMPSPPLSDASASPEIGRTIPALQPEHRTLKRATTIPDATAFRCVPPRYRQPGSLPFSFAGPPCAAASVVGLGTQPTSSVCAPRPLKAEATMILTDELTPRMFCSPLPMSESGVDTPSTSCGNSWSPAPSATSTDSSDSGSSVGSVATPPDLARYNFGKNSAYLDTSYFRGLDVGLSISEHSKLDGASALSGLQIGCAGSLENWYSQVLSSRALMGDNQLPMLGNMVNDTIGQF